MPPMGSFARKIRRSRVSGSTGNAIEQIAKLRDLVANSSNLSEPADFFDEEVGPNPDFAKLSLRRDNELLCSMVQVLSKIALSEYECVEKRIYHVSGEHLWHGVLVLLSGSMARIVYFEDSNRGLCSVVRKGDGETKHLRFSIPEDVREPIDPSTTVVESISRRSQDPRPN